MKLIEGAAEESEELLEKFLDDHDSITPDEIIAALRKATLEAALHRFFAVHLSKTKVFRN